MVTSLSAIKEILAREGFRKYIRSTGWMFGGKLASMAISFIATLYIARHLGPTNFGQLSYALSIVGIFGFLAPLGLDSILYRELIKFPEKKNQLLGTSFLLKLAAGIITSLCIITYAISIGTDDVSRMAVIILSFTFILSPFQVITYEFLSRSESKVPALITMLTTLLLNLLKVVALMNGKGVLYIAFVLFLEPLFYALFYVYAYAKDSNDSLTSWTYDKKLAVSLLKDSLPLVLLSSFTIVYARVDQVLIKQMIGTMEVGIYDAAVRLADLWNFIPGIILSALFPSIVKNEASATNESWSRMKKIGVLLFIIPVGIAIVTTIFAPLIISILYGPAFSASVPILKIYIWSCIGTFLGILTQTYMTAKNQRVLVVISSFVPMVVNISLNLLWIPTYGVIGSAYATVISYALVPVFIIFSKR
jgi:O-antigen/teichoic acid export membrane protein